MARLAGAKVGRKIGLTAGAVAGRKAGAKACILAVDNAIQEVSRDKVAALRVLFAEIAFKAGKFETLFMKNIFKYRGYPPYEYFGTWKKPCYMKFISGTVASPLRT